MNMETPSSLGPLQTQIVKKTVSPVHDIVEVNILQLKQSSTCTNIPTVE